jgi:hypothetical protein
VATRRELGLTEPAVSIFAGTYPEETSDHAMYDLSVASRKETKVSIFTPGGDIRTGRAWSYGCLTAFLLFIVLPLALWAFGVFSSGVRGAANVVKQNNDANNRIQAQATFNKLWGDIQADQIDIDGSAATVKAAGGASADPYDQSVLTAEEQTCTSAAETYNADADNTTMKDWRPAGDPASVDPTEECEPQP